MNLLNGSDHENLMTPVAIDARPIRQLVRARDVAKKLGVSISWVIQHLSDHPNPANDDHPKTGQRRTTIRVAFSDRLD